MPYVTEATPAVLFSTNAAKERETATTTLTAKESSNVGETTASKILTMGSTRLMTAALIQCQQMQLEYYPSSMSSLLGIV